MSLVEAVEAKASQTSGWGLVEAVLSAPNTEPAPKQVNRLDRMCILDLVDKVAQTTKDLRKTDIAPLERQSLLVELEARVETLRTTVQKLL